jgi:hypothetical protein
MIRSLVATPFIMASLSHKKLGRTINATTKTPEDAGVVMPHAGVHHVAGPPDPTDRDRRHGHYTKPIIFKLIKYMMI